MEEENVRYEALRDHSSEQAGGMSSGEEDGVRHRRRRSAGTLYSLAESTYTAWERVKEKYARDPVTRTANLTDVGRGYRSMDPLSSRWVVMSLSALLVSYGAVQVYFNLELLLSLAKQLRIGLVEVAVSALVLIVVHIAYRVRRPM